ncbi:uidB, partial [Symbiodinium necroappetens]
ATHVSVPATLAYGLPGVGFGAFVVMISLYLPSLYAENQGVPLSQIGAVTTVVQIFDAISDPLLGYLSDRCRTSWGRRRPFLLLGSSFLAISFVALFSPPNLGNPTSALAFAAAFGLLTQMFLTVARIPWMAWAIDLNSDYDAKTRLVSVREFMWVLGAMLGAVLPSVAGALLGDSGPLRLTLAASFWAVFMVVSGVLCFCLVPDTTAASAPGGVRDGSASSQMSFLRNISGYRPAIALYIATVLALMATTGNALLYPFFVKYVLEDEGVEWLLGLYIFLGAVFVPFWAWVAKKFDKKMTLTFITLVQFSVLGLIFAAVERQALGMYVACIISAGTVMGGSSVVRFSMMADVADALQLLTRGHRDEAKIVALFDISSKLAASLLVALGFLFIDTAGFRADVVPQPEAARFAIRFFYSLVPSILALLSAIVIWAL